MSEAYALDFDDDWFIAPSKPLTELTKAERRRINLRLKPHGLHLCPLCNEPCAFDEFYSSGGRCIRCQRILFRVQVAPAFVARASR